MKGRVPGDPDRGFHDWLIWFQKLIPDDKVLAAAIKEASVSDPHIARDKVAAQFAEAGMNQPWQRAWVYRMAKYRLIFGIEAFENLIVEIYDRRDFLAEIDRRKAVKRAVRELNKQLAQLEFALA